MNILPLGDLQARLDLYREAERKILQNQSYTIGTRTYTRTNLKQVQEAIKGLENTIAGASGTGTIRVRKVLFRDD